MKLLKLSNLLAIVALSGLTVMTSCDGGDDESDPQPVKPSLSFFGGEYTDEDETVRKGDTVEFKWRAESGDNELKKFSITGGEQGGTRFDSSNLSEDNASVYVDDYSTKMNSEGEYTFTFEVWDQEDSKTTKKITITVKDGPLNTYDGTLEAPTGNEESKSFYAASYAAGEGKAYSKKEADGDATIQGQIDFGYWYSTKDSAIAVSIKDYPASVYDLSGWTTRNETKFKTTALSSSEFDNISSRTKIVAEAQGASEARITGLNVDDVIAFITQEGNSALMKINDLVATGSSNGQIKFTIKIAKN